VGNPTTWRFQHNAMNAPFEVHLWGDDEHYAGQVADAIFRDIDHAEALLSHFREDSDVGRVGLLEGGQSVQVSTEMMDCLLVALWVHSETGGAFDVMLGRGLNTLVLNPDSLSVGVTKDGGTPQIDLGGIGKGFALDRAAEIVAEWGLEDALLTAGPSTVLALGTQDGEPWSVGVNGTVQVLTDQALSASGKDVQGAHVLDPRKREPASGHEKAWAIAPSAAVADALSTAFMVMDRTEVETCCRSHEGIEGHVLSQDGEFISFG
jgi:thiamine biosynthesis lipoprotein